MVFLLCVISLTDIVLEFSTLEARLEEDELFKEYFNKYINQPVSQCFKFPLFEPPPTIRATYKTIVVCMSVCLSVRVFVRQFISFF